MINLIMREGENFTKKENTQNQNLTARAKKYPVYWQI